MRQETIRRCVYRSVALADRYPTRAWTYPIVQIRKLSGDGSLAAFSRCDLTHEQGKGLLELSEAARAEDRRDLPLGILRLCPNDVL